MPTVKRPQALPSVSDARRGVKQRWFYEPRAKPALALVMGPGSIAGSEAGGAETQPAASGAGSLVPSQAPVGVGVQDGGSSSAEGGQTSPHFPGPGNTHTPLSFCGAEGDRFTVILFYPGGERPTHPYTVFRGMPVSFLRYNLACLLELELPVSLFVGPNWGALAHSGTITDRVFPGTTILCPYVEPGSGIRVQVAPAPFLVSLVLLVESLLDHYS